MKREGTGEPRNPDISLHADVQMRELSFEKAPDPQVRFRGTTERNSVWRSRRKNLPDEVQEGVVYRDATVRLWIASEVARGDPGFRNSSKEERVKTRTEDVKRDTEEQRLEGTEVKEKR